MRPLLAPALLLLTLTASAQQPASRHAVHVAAAGKADFHTVQEAVDSAPADGLVVLIAPGVYKEKVAVTQANIALVGTGVRPQDTVITFADSAKNTGSTFKSGTVTVTADGFEAENLSIVNTWWDEHTERADASQAVALQLSSDRSVVDRVRMVSGQDTLFAASRTCGGNIAEPGCAASRQFFNDCYVEGNVDYIFGDAKAVFSHCELHSRPHPTVMITAQRKRFADEDSGYWMLHCRITGANNGDKVVLGRPWRDYATVTFFDTDMQQNMAPDGWSEWGGRLKTATYREYDSHGAGVNGTDRVLMSPPLTPAERAAMTSKALLAGKDDWDPEADVRELRRLAP